MLQKHFQLRWVEFFAARSKDFSDQQIDFLAKQRVFRPLFFQCRLQDAVLFQQLLFAHAFHCTTMKQDAGLNHHFQRCFLYSPRSYQGRIFAPCSSMPSVSIARASGRNSMAFSSPLGHE